GGGRIRDGLWKESVIASSAFGSGPRRGRADILIGGADARDVFDQRWELLEPQRLGSIAQRRLRIRVEIDQYHRGAADHSLTDDVEDVGQPIRRPLQPADGMGGIP